MRLILLGPPGSGKGTQAQLLRDRQALVHISTGDILREAIRLGTLAGKKAEGFMTQGQLVPDDLVNEIIADRFRRDDRPTRFLMDGYPRTLPQAAAFDAMLRQQFLDLTGVIVLRVNDQDIVDRLSGRWICPKCQRPYHVKGNPPKQPGVCDDDGAKLVQRTDDNEGTVRKRLEVYHRQTAELIPHYARQGLLREIVGTGDIEAIYQKIAAALGV